MTSEEVIEAELRRAQRLIKEMRAHLEAQQAQTPPSTLTRELVERWMREATNEDVCKAIEEWWGGLAKSDEGEFKDMILDMYDEPSDVGGRWEEYVSSDQSNENASNEYANGYYEGKRDGESAIENMDIDTYAMAEAARKIDSASKENLMGEIEITDQMDFARALRELQSAAYSAEGEIESAVASLENACPDYTNYGH